MGSSQLQSEATFPDAGRTSFPQQPLRSLWRIWVPEPREEKGRGFGVVVGWWGETHQDRGYRMAIDIFFWLGKEGRLTFSWCVFAGSPFGYRKKAWWCIMIAETSLDNIKVLDTASNATMSGTSKGLENGVLEGSENTKFVGKIRWFRILFVARIRYYWEFR